MPISLIKIDNFRNISNVKLDSISSRLNIICGNNGAGKTSLLEAIYYISHGRSFRSSNASCLVRHQKDKFSIYSQLLSEDSIQTSIGIERMLTGSNKLRMADREAISIAELAQLLPVRIINSHSHALFESGPAFRRKYLDWGLFYQYPEFLHHWRQYEKALRQRNAALKAKRPKNELLPWTEELLKHGLRLDEMRRQYIDLLGPHIAEYAHDLLGISNVEIQYQPGWDEGRDFASVLEERFTDEYRLGSTQYGPHRADFEALIDSSVARHFLSRGQQKLLICAMILAQGRSLAGHTNRSLIYLVDDLPSELDLISREKLVALLIKQKTQIFITAIDSKDVHESVSDQLDVEMAVFHVEHGSIIHKGKPLGA